MTSVWAWSKGPVNIRSNVMAVLVAKYSTALPLRSCGRIDAVVLHRLRYAGRLAIAKNGLISVDFITAVSPHSMGPEQCRIAPIPIDHLCSYVIVVLV